MKKTLFLFFCCTICNLLVVSCKKDAKVSPVDTHATTLGLYQYGSDNAKRVFIIVSKIGTVSKSYPSVFDTGSVGMTLDAHDILPASMITDNGLLVTGDSVVVKGITVTSQELTMSYGDKTGSVKEYGNLAYAAITIGDENGNISSKRVPFFLYYKIVDGNGKQETDTHTLDVFGVGPGVSTANGNINSPLNYFDTGSDIKGFKLATLKSGSFGTGGNAKYVGGLLSIKLTPDDISSSSGFIMHPLAYRTIGGYSPNIPSTITYSGKSVAAQVLFDSGTPTYSVIENSLETNSIGQLPANTQVTITTNRGFTYSYFTQSAGNLTTIQNPNNTGDFRTIFSIDFFVDNEYLTDYTNHQIGLKNN